MIAWAVQSVRVTMLAKSVPTKRAPHIGKHAQSIVFINILGNFLIVLPGPLKLALPLGRIEMRCMNGVSAIIAQREVVTPFDKLTNRVAGP